MATQKVDVPKQEEGVADPKVADDSKDGWDEAELEAGLKKLKEMHIQLRHLRSTIPRLVTPLTKKHKSPQSLLTGYKGAVQTMKKEVGEFREIMTGQEAKKVLEYAEERKEKVPGPVKPWIVTEHPGWSTRDSSARDS